jgi:hypothetical protein
MRRPPAPHAQRDITDFTPQSSDARHRRGVGALEHGRKVGAFERCAWRRLYLHLARAVGGRRLADDLVALEHDRRHVMVAKFAQRRGSVSGEDIEWAFPEKDQKRPVVVSTRKKGSGMVRFDQRGGARDGEVRSTSRVPPAMVTEVPPRVGPPVGSHSE